MQDDVGGGKGPPDAPKIWVPHRVVYKIKITFFPIDLCTKFIIVTESSYTVDVKEIICQNCTFDSMKTLEISRAL